MAETNPNGANQYQLDPRQKLCWEFYANPKSETFNNGLASAIKAGYSESHANTITTEPWFRDRVRRINLLHKAENVLEEMLDMPVETSKMERLGFGEDAEYEEVVRTEPALVKIKQDTAKFVAERVGKEVYSNRQELTGSDGEDLIPKPLLGGQSNGIPDNNSNEEAPSTQETN